MRLSDEVLTRRQFLRGNALLVIALAFLGFSLKPFSEAFRSLRRGRQPNISDKEARFYTTLAG